MSSARHPRVFLVLVCLLLATAACRRSASPPQQVAKPDATDASTAQAQNVVFQDITEASGVASTYRNGEQSDQYVMVESLGGGVGVLDFDLDGRPDLFFPGGGSIEFNEPLSGLPGTLWRATGDLLYREVTTPAGVDDATLYTHGVAIADIDHDGFPDILVAGFGGVQLFHNCGDGTFAEKAAEIGLDADSWSSSAAWGDFDGDGYVDLYLANYLNWSWDNHPHCPGPPPNGREICAPQQFEGLADTVFWNNGDGTFRQGDASVGLLPAGKGLGVIAVDVDHDSRLDVYVANDTDNNYLYRNEGNGSFREMGIVSGTALDHLGIPNGSMGIAVLDYDGDLLPEIFVTNYERETFAVYKNEGAGNFRCISERTGITALGTLFVGFGTASGDFNHNGREDLVVANGHLMRHTRRNNLRQHPLYLANTGDGRIQRLTFEPSSYFSQKHIGRGVISADLNGNGLLDLVFSHTNHPATILENRSPTDGSWIMIRLIGTTSNRDAIGARVVLETTGGKSLRHVFGGGSYLSQGLYDLHWGLPPGEEPVAAEIVWPDGARQKLVDLAKARLHVVVQ